MAAEERHLGETKEKKKLKNPEFIQAIPGTPTEFAVAAVAMLDKETYEKYEQDGIAEIRGYFSYDEEKQSLQYIKHPDGLTYKYESQFDVQALPPNMRTIAESAARDAARKHDLSQVTLTCEIKIQKVGAYRKTAFPGFHYDGGPSNLLIGEYFFASILPTEVVTGSISAEEEAEILATNPWDEAIEVVQRTDTARSSLLPMSVYDGYETLHAVSESIMDPSFASSLESSGITDETPRVFVRVFVFKTSGQQEQGID